MTELLNPGERLLLKDELKWSLRKIALNLATPMAPPNIGSGFKLPAAPNAAAGAANKPAGQPAMGASVPSPKMPTFSTPSITSSTKTACARELLSMFAVSGKQAEALVATPAPTNGISAEEAQAALKRLQKLEKSKPAPEELRRGAAIGAAVSPLATVASRTISGDPLFGRPAAEALQAVKGLSGVGRIKALAKVPIAATRNLGASSVMGAFFGGALPALKTEVGREAERAKLKEYLGQQDNRSRLSKAVINVTG